MIRLVAVQRCPVVPNPPHSPPSIASSRFASSSTIIGFFPPSSNEQCLKLFAAVVPTVRPTAVDPVSETARTSECSVNGPPTLDPNPLTTLITPLGTPASVSVRTRLKVERGVSCAGLMTHVFPQTSAGSSIHGRIHIVFSGFLKDSDLLPRIRGIPVFECLPRRGLDPLAVNEVLINLGIPTRYEGRAAHSLGRHNFLLINKPIYPCYSPTGGRASEAGCMERRTSLPVGEHDNQTLATRCPISFVPVRGAGTPVAPLASPSCLKNVLTLDHPPGSKLNP